MEDYRQPHHGCDPPEVDVIRGLERRVQGKVFTHAGRKGPPEVVVGYARGKPAN
jgi:hypothetical protein